MNIEITKEQMLLDINDYLCAACESLTCSGETNLNPNGYIVFGVFNISSSTIVNGWRYYETSKNPFPETVTDQMIFDFWKKVKGL